MINRFSLGQLNPDLHDRCQVSQTKSDGYTIIDMTIINWSVHRQMITKRRHCLTGWCHLLTWTRKRADILSFNKKASDSGIASENQELEEEGICYLFPKEETDTQGKFLQLLECLVCISTTFLHVLCISTDAKVYRWSVCVSYFLRTSHGDNRNGHCGKSCFYIRLLMLCFIANKSLCSLHILLWCLWNRQKRREDGRSTALAISSVLVSSPSSFKLMLFPFYWDVLIYLHCASIIIYVI